MHKIEIIGLISLLSRLSESIEYYKQFLQKEEKIKHNTTMLKHIAAYFAIVTVFSLFKIIDFLEFTYAKKGQNVD